MKEFTALSGLETPCDHGEGSQVKINKLQLSQHTDQSPSASSNSSGGQTEEGGVAGLGLGLGLTRLDDGETGILLIPLLFRVEECEVKGGQGKDHGRSGEIRAGQG